MVIDFAKKEVLSWGKTCRWIGSMHIDGEELSSESLPLVRLSFETYTTSFDLHTGDTVFIHDNGILVDSIIGVLTNWENEFYPLSGFYDVRLTILVETGFELLMRMAKPSCGRYSWNNEEEQKREDKNMKFDMTFDNGTLYCCKIAIGNPVERVIYNNPATIVFFKDGDKVVVKCSDKDTYDPEKGLAMALCKKMLGYKEYKKTFKTHVPDEGFRNPYARNLWTGYIPQLRDKRPNGR